MPSKHFIDASTNVGTLNVKLPATISTPTSATIYDAHDGSTIFIYNVGTTNSIALYDSTGTTLIQTIPTGNSAELVAYSSGANKWTQIGGSTAWSGGSVTSFAFTNGGGINGTVSNPTTMPNLSLSPSFPVSGTVIVQSNGSAFSGVSSVNNAVLVTNGSGVPSLSTTLPNAVQGNITTVGTIGTGTWQGSVIALAYGGTNANLTASNGGIVYSGSSALGILAGTATANQVLLSGSSTTPAWSTATYPASTTINQLLYSSSANTIAGLATANNGVLITSSGGVPSISSTLPSAVQGNITTVGTITSGTWNGSVIGLAYGGTNANLTAVAGGSVYSTGSALAITAAGTAGQILYSNGASPPTWANVPSITTTLQQAYNNNSSSPTTIGISSANGPLLVYNYNTTSLQQVFGVSGYSASPTYGNYFAVYETGSATQNAIIGLNASAPTINAVNSIALGTSATANVTNGFAFGTSAVSSSNYAIAFGANTLASGSNSIAIGGDATASTGAQSTNSQTIAIGDASSVSGYAGLAIGPSAIVTTAYSIAIGSGAVANTTGGTESIAIGYQTNSGGMNSITLGSSSTTSNEYGASIGNGITNAQNYTTIFNDGLYTISNSGLSQPNRFVASYSKGFQLVGDTTLGARVLPATGNASNSPSYFITQGQALTTDAATAQTLVTIVSSTNSVLGLHGYLVGSRTGGTSGSAGNSWYYEFVTKANNVAGTLTSMLVSLPVGLEDVSGPVISSTVSGTSLLIQINGISNYNITWNLSLNINELVYA